MRLKTFTAPDMPAALKLLRTELGPDALILSTRKTKTESGTQTLEITAALPDGHEGDQTTPATLPLRSAAEALQSAKRSERGAGSITLPTGNALSQHSLPHELHQRLTTAMAGLEPAGFTGAEALEMVLPKILPLTTPPQQLPAGHCHVFIGPHGAGKTTLMGKLALQAAAGRETKIGLLSLDDYKIAGFEPLQTVAEILADQAVLLRGPDDLARAAKTLGPRRLMLVDTPGLTGSAADAALQTALLQRLNALGLPYTCHLVLPANLHPSELAALPAAYQRFNPASLIATKIDVTGHLGGLLAASHQHNLPIGLAADSPALDTPPLALTAPWLAQTLTRAPLLPWETRTLGAA